MTQFRRLAAAAAFGSILCASGASASTPPRAAAPQQAPATAETPAALAAHLKAEIVKAEAAATAAFFPRRNVLAAVSKSMWTVFYEGRYAADQQSAAIDLVAAETDLSPIAREAVDRMKVELTLD